MIRDPLYRSIIEGLNSSLHEESFERCAQALLKPLYPTLVPIRGGSDGGMDGLTADVHGKPIVLVATAGERAKRNLQDSLKSMLADKNPCRRVVSATSRKLTPDNQRELREAAAELGFKLIQIHEQAAFADLLYENARWRKELLGLTGEPPPLSAIPRSTRPRLTTDLVGHELDAKWLVETAGDRLLLGQPGSGKSFLLSNLALEHGWLFVVSKDLVSLADGIREQKPAAIIYDDAHNDPEFVKTLAELRTGIEADFQIIASSWPGAAECLAELLFATDAKTRKLGRLTRPEIAIILEAAGLPRESETLVYEILNQADGRPGLAITLAHLCLFGNEVDLEKVVFGEALLSSIRNVLERLVSPLAIQILAVLSVGGDAGMRMQAAAEFLEKPIADIKLAMTGLAASGVINDVDGQHLSVRPEELRYALIRNTFFSGATSLDITPLLEQVPCFSAAAETLVNARHYGAPIPDDLLRPLVLKSDSTTAWTSFAWLGVEETAWALEHYREDSCDLIQPALRHKPERIIPTLLERAIGDHRTLHSHPDHPLRRIEDWVGFALPETGEAVPRRNRLLTAAAEWLTSGKDQQVGTHAMAIALKPDFSAHSSDPVLGLTVTLRWGLLSAKELAQLADLWSAGLDCLQKVEISNWKYILAVVGDWVYPHRHARGSLPEPLIASMHKIAATALKRIAVIGKSNPALIHSAGPLAADLGIELEAERNPEFEALFPIDVRDSASWAKQEKVVRDLANRWASDPPKDVVRQVCGLERQAEFVDGSDRFTPFLMHEIAGQISSPLEWIAELLAEEARGDLLSPFLGRAAQLKSPGWEEVAISCLANESTRCIAVVLALTLPDPPEALLENALQSLRGLAKSIQHLCWRKAISESTLGRLLRHPDDAVASLTALGMWSEDRTAKIPANLEADWRTAVLRANHKEHSFGELVKEHPDIAFEWLRKEIQRKDSLWSRHSAGQKGAFASLSVDQRRELLRELPDSFWSRDVPATLVGDDVDLLRELLSMNRLKHLHLAPLRGNPNAENWKEKAKAAVEAGYLPEEIAIAAFRAMTGWTGKESNMYSTWVERFESLSSDESEDIRRIGEAGAAVARADRDSAMKRERAEETYGRP